MEESLDLLQYTKEQFQLKEMDITNYSPLTLAYIGDAIYEAVIRTVIVSGGNTQVNKLHKKSSSLVKASAQAELIKLIMDDMTEEETAIYKRGRNAKSATVAKNASVTDYRMATGFEALMGYLYLTGRTGRMIDLIRLGLERKRLNPA